MSTTIQKRPGGRSTAVLNSIKIAVEELVAERGRERVTIPMVAERAGVNPTSVYRRWGDLQTMINDIATYRLDPARPIPELGTLKADLAEWAREIVEHYRNPTNAALLRGGAASAGVSESDCTRNRRAEAGMMVERYGKSSPITADDVLDHLVAPIIYRVIFLPWTLDDATADSLVEALFAGH
ncbi:MAG TPA: TetR/AcrR family transcriptional regulator [Galbitalea sp.]|jgi:AcrR family transcriptional regulator|nr:TetR/AcrR family transcriptional regulator [Galbitalea sp.]